MIKLGLEVSSYWDRRKKFKITDKKKTSNNKCLLRIKDDKMIKQSPQIQTHTLSTVSVQNKYCRALTNPKHSGKWLNKDILQFTYIVKFLFATPECLRSTCQSISAT